MKSIYTLSVFAFITLMASSCKKSFLEVLPKGRLIATNTNDYNLTLNSLSYINFGEFTETLAPVVLGDEIVSIEPYFTGASRRYQRLFRFENDIYNGDEDAIELKVPMQNIYMYNKIINEVMSSTGGTEQQKLSIQAEARLGRAWTYFLLINFYGKQYRESTAATDLGFPIIQVNDLARTDFDRNTVKEVYDFIIDDLLLALKDAPLVLSNRMRASKPACEGLLAKVYSYMERYEEALPYYNNVLNTMGNSFISIGLLDYADLESDELFGYSFPNLPENKEVIFAKQMTNVFSFFNNELLVNTAVSSLYSPSDYRAKFYSDQTLFGDPYPSGFLRRQSPDVIPIGVSIPELYLLRAECLARLGQLNAAVADLDILRSMRIQEPEDRKIPLSALASKENLIRFVFEERLREFATLGFRWYDLRRMANDPIFGSNTYQHLLYNTDGSVKEVYPMDPNRLVLRMPAKILLENPRMQDNP